MKKLLFIILSVLCLYSCKDDNEAVLNQLSVQLTSDQPINDFSTFNILLTDLKSGQSYNQKADTKGKAVFSLPLGSYNIEAEYQDKGATVSYGRKDNVIFSENTQVEIKVVSANNAFDKTFVLDELYFNGNKNGNYDYTFYEQYFTIRNISNKPLFADGLSFGITGDFNTTEETSEMQKLLPDVVVLSQFYTIPGNGRTHKVDPGKSIVIAMSAINHKEGGDKPNSLDLSGADFEIYVENAMTPDNPEVENVIVNFSTYQAFSWQYSGATPMVLFRLPENESAEKFIAKNKDKFINPNSFGTMIQDYVKLPSKYIIDGVETGVINAMYHKTLPGTVDLNAFMIPGTGMPGDGFYGYFVQRKRIQSEDGHETVQDTNSGKDDFEMIKGGAKSYPKK